RIISKSLIAKVCLSNSSINPISSHGLYMVKKLKREIPNIIGRKRRVADSRHACLGHACRGHCEVPPHPLIIVENRELIAYLAINFSNHLQISKKTFCTILIANFLPHQKRYGSHAPEKKIFM